MTCDIEVVRSIAEAERKAIVADNMLFTSEEAEKFWPVYNEFREEARKVGDKRVQVIRDLANEFKTLDDARAEEMLREVLDFQADRARGARLPGGPGQAAQVVREEIQQGDPAEEDSPLLPD